VIRKHGVYLISYRDTQFVHVLKERRQVACRHGPEQQAQEWAMCIGTDKFYNMAMAELLQDLNLFAFSGPDSGSTILFLQGQSLALAGRFVYATVNSISEKPALLKGQRLILAKFNVRGTSARPVPDALRKTIVRHQAGCAVGRVHVKAAALVNMSKRIGHLALDATQFMPFNSDEYSRKDCTTHPIALHTRLRWWNGSTRLSRYLNRRFQRAYNLGLRYDDRFSEHKRLLAGCSSEQPQTGVGGSHHRR
jgi:hypothetical protein